jgi:hypothetical protein
MAWSLSLIVLGITLSYVFFKVEPQNGKTLNAVLFDSIAKGWGMPGYVFVLITLVSEATLLFVAAQTGFVDGPRVIANMAKDRWMPTRFALLSDRLVAQNGVVMMSAAALFTLFLTGGSVKYLVVLYSINVFITFTLSQMGMVLHWWKGRKNRKEMETQASYKRYRIFSYRVYPDNGRSDKIQGRRMDNAVYYDNPGYACVLRAQTL